MKKRVVRSQGKPEKKNGVITGKNTTVRELVGKKCLIQCFLHRQKTQALWDTGSQVCAVDEVWKHNHLLNVPLRDIAELVESTNSLQLEADNRTEMPYVGWLEIPFQLTASDHERLIPVLVLKGKQQQCPIIGFNVIEHIVLHSQGEQRERRDKEELVRAVKMAFPYLRKNKAKTSINAVSLGQTREYKVRTVNKRISVPKCSFLEVECRIQPPPFKENTNLIFEPHDVTQWPEGLEFCDTVVSVKAGMAPKIIISVQNSTNHEIILPGRTVIGSVQSVMSEYPVNIFTENHSSAHLPTPPTPDTQDQKPIESNPRHEQGDPPIDLSHL